MGEELSLFDQGSNGGYGSPLLIVKDGNVVDISLDALFDTKRFQELRAIAFVTSPAFFFSAAQHFDRVELVLGIEDQYVAEAFQDGLQDLLNIEKRVAFFDPVRVSRSHGSFQNLFDAGERGGGGPDA